MQKTLSQPLDTKYRFLLHSNCFLNLYLNSCSKKKWALLPFFTGDAKTDLLITTQHWRLEQALHISLTFEVAKTEHCFDLTVPA